MTKRILIVDDSVEITDLLGDLLTDEGYIVVTYNVAIKTLGPVRRANPDLVILDHWVDGAESSQQTIAMLRQSGDLSQIPILICTSVENAALILAHELEADDIALITKPFDVGDMIDAVRLLLDNAAAMQLRPPPPEFGPSPRLLAKVSANFRICHCCAAAHDGGAKRLPARR